MKSSRKFKRLPRVKMIHRQGFTLVETLVAMVLFAISMLAVVPMAINTSRQTTILNHRSLAITLAQSKIDDLKRLAVISPLSGANNQTENNLDASGAAGNGIFTRVVTVTGGAGQLTTLNVIVTWTDYSAQTVTQTTLLSQ